MPPKETKHGQLARWRDGNANTITLTNANATSTPCILRVAISGAERSQSTPRPKRCVSSEQKGFRAEKRRKVVYTAERTQKQNHTMTQTRLGRPMTQTRLGRPRVLRKTLETKHVIGESSVYVTSPSPSMIIIRCSLIQKQTTPACFDDHPSTAAWPSGKPAR